MRSASWAAYVRVPHGYQRVGKGNALGDSVIVGVISDTHNPSVGVLPPPEVAIAFQGVDVILHAGDIYVPSCLDWLEAIA